MSTIEQGLYQLGRLDELARQNTGIHRLDPRAKVMTTLVFLACVVSFGKYDILPLLPFVIFPIVIAGEGRLPLGWLLKKLLIVAPFAALVGIFNPLFDREIILQFGTLGISGGWISFISILFRFFLTTIAALILIGTTSFSGVCMAIERLGAPDIFAAQLLFLYRYIFVLGEEVMRMSRARALRSFNGRGMGIGIYSQMLGHLLLRTFDRAHRIYMAMLCRNFDGHIRASRRLRLTARDAVFTLGWSTMFIVFRLYNMPLLLGQTITSVLS